MSSFPNYLRHDVDSHRPFSSLISAARARYGIPANDPQAFAVAYAKLRRQQDSLRVRQDRSVDSSRVPEYAGYERQQLRQRTTGRAYTPCI